MGFPLCMSADEHSPPIAETHVSHGACPAQEHRVGQSFFSSFVSLLEIGTSEHHNRDQNA
jgi:hypothetical protein